MCKKIVYSIFAYRRKVPNLTHSLCLHTMKKKMLFKSLYIKISICMNNSLWFLKFLFFFQKTFNML